MEHGVPGLNRRPDFELAHIGVNASNSENAKRIADDFCQVFDRSIRAGESSVFVGKEIEVMRGIGRGTCGHIALATPSVENAISYFREKKIEVDESSAKYDDAGKLKAIYLKGEIGGFAVHLLRKQSAAQSRDAMIDWILREKIIAIIRNVPIEHIEMLSGALYRGGIEIMEVTFDQSDEQKRMETIKAIRTLRETSSQKMLIGAGTVTSVRLAEEACEAGAQFIVSPDTQIEVIRRTRSLGMVSIPGAYTPSEVIAAHEAGADFVKLFPAGVLGTTYLKAIRGPINHVRLLAVGGVNEMNAKEFLDAGCVGVGVGGNLVNRTWIEAGEYDRISDLAAQYIQNLG